MLYLGKLPIAKAALKPTLKSLVMFAAYNLFFGLAPGIDNSAHLGGLAAGLGLGAVLARSLLRTAGDPRPLAQLRGGRNDVAPVRGIQLPQAEITPSRTSSRNPSPCHPDRSGAQRAEWRDLLFACATAKDQSQLTL